MVRLNLLAVAALSATLGACAQEPLLPEFPAEKSVDEYPGVEYPAFDGPLPRPGSLAGPVWLVGIDGATWDLMLPMVERGELPRLAALMERGCHGVLLSEEPLLSPALWTTIATGMPRAVHRVASFVTKVPGEARAVEVGPPDRRSPALWELVGAAGGRSCVVNWYGSFPAERISGVFVSKGLDPADPRPGQVEPWTLAAELEAAAETRIRREDVAAIAVTQYLGRTLELDARALAVLRAAVGLSPTDLVALYLPGIDVVEHLCWRHMDPESQAFPEDGQPEPGLADVIPAYYRFVDWAIGEIVALAPDNATFVIVSDHGHGPIDVAEAFHLQLDVLLEQMGLRDDGRGEVLAVDELYRHDKTVWLNLEGVEENGTVPLEEARSVAGRLAERLRALRTDDGDRLMSSVVDHTASASWRPGDPALKVRFSPIALLATTAFDGDRRLDLGKVRQRHVDVSGAHRPDGVLIIAGPAVRRGVRLDPADLFQVAPTVLYLLGMPQDMRMLARQPVSGGVLESAIDPSVLASRPPRSVGEYPGTDRSHLLRGRTGEPLPEDPVRDEALERLRALGYIR